MQLLHLNAIDNFSTIKNMFSYTQRVLFKHCDPAGIVFYPRYIEMLNDVIEEFFDSSLNHSFGDIHPDNGVPTAQLGAKFSAPSRLGDILHLRLVVREIGRSSLKLEIETRCEDELRFSANLVLVYIDENGKSTPWSDSLRQALLAQIQDPDSAQNQQ